MTNYSCIALLTFVKFVSPVGVGKSDWEKLNQELKTKLSPLHRDISQVQNDNPGLIQQLGDRLTCEIREFFVEHSDFFEHEA